MDAMACNNVRDSGPLLELYSFRVRSSRACDLPLSFVTTMFVYITPNDSRLDTRGDR